MMRKKITKIEKYLKALNKWLVGDKKKAKKKAAKKIKRKKCFLKKCEKVNTMMTEPIPQRLRVEFLG